MQLNYIIKKNKDRMNINIFYDNNTNHINKTYSSKMYFIFKIRI